MNLFRNLSLFLFFAFSTITLVAQSSFTKGVIFSVIDSSKILHAHIINTTSKIGVTSNENGEFTIEANLQDSLVISFIGYESLKFIVSKITSIIYLEKIVYNIEPYTVLPYKDFNEFREAFTNLELADTIKHKMNHSIMALIEPFNPTNLNGGITFSGPISAIAAKFNKRIIDRKNYKELLKGDKYKASLATKFNSKIIKQATTLKEANQINYFTEYCDFTDQFIEFSSHFNLVDQIINCFDEYNNLPLGNK